MANAELPSPDEARPLRPTDSDWVEDELIGLDRDDPEVQAFADHLRRMHTARPAFTVEGYIAGVSDFAESVNRSEGSRWLGAVLLVALLLVVAAFVVWESVHFMLSTWW